MQAKCCDGARQLLHAFWFCVSQICVRNSTQLLSGHEKNVFGVLENIQKWEEEKLILKLMSCIWQMNTALNGTRFSKQLILLWILYIWKAGKWLWSCSGFSDPQWKHSIICSIDSSAWQWSRRTWVNRATSGHPSRLLVLWHRAEQDAKELEEADSRCTGAVFVSPEPRSRVAF